MVATPKP